MMDQAPEDIRRNEEEAEHRQLEAESLVEAQGDREMFDRDSDESLGRDKEIEESDIMKGSLLAALKDLFTIISEIEFDDWENKADIEARLDLAYDVIEAAKGEQ